MSAIADRAASHVAIDSSWSTRATTTSPARSRSLALYQALRGAAVPVELQYRRRGRAWVRHQEVATARRGLAGALRGVDEAPGHPAGRGGAALPCCPGVSPGGASCPGGAVTGRPGHGQRSGDAPPRGSGDGRSLGPLRYPSLDSLPTSRVDSRPWGGLTRDIPPKEDPACPATAPVRDRCLAERGAELVIFPTQSPQLTRPGMYAATHEYQISGAASPEEAPDKVRISWIIPGLEPCGLDFSYWPW